MKARSFIVSFAGKYIIMVLIWTILMGWPMQILAQESQAKPNNFIPICVLLVGGALATWAGYELYQSLCKLQSKIDKQHEDPDDPPPSTNSPPPMPPPPPPPKKTGVLNGKGSIDGPNVSEYALAMTLITSSNYTTTDISEKSIVDSVLGLPYTVWSRVEVDSGLSLTSRSTNSPRVALRINCWTVNAGNISNGRILSAMVVIDGDLVYPVTNYVQCLNESGHNYVNDVMSGLQLWSLSRSCPLDAACPGKFFWIKPQAP